MFLRTSVHIRNTQHCFSEDGNTHVYLSENLMSCIWRLIALSETSRVIHQFLQETPGIF
jgi:hypothetical protein